MPLYTEETFKKHWMANIVEGETIDKRVVITFPDYEALLNRGWESIPTPESEEDTEEEPPEAGFLYSS